MLRRTILSLTAGLLLVAGCNDAAVMTPVQSGAARTPLTPAFNSTPGNHICSFVNEWTNPTVYVGHTLLIHANEQLCDDATHAYVGDGTATFQSNATGVATVNTFIGLTTTLTAVADGNATISIDACCDQGGNPVHNDTYVTVQHAPLTVNVTGDASVNTGPSCQYDSNASAGYPGYTYQWSADGTIVGSSTSSQVTVQFTSDGTHLVSVLVTDSHSHQTSGGMFVTSSTTSPPSITCS